MCVCVCVLTSPLHHFLFNLEVMVIVMCVRPYIHTSIPKIYCSPSRGIIEDTTVYRKRSVYIFPLICILPQRGSVPRPPTRPTPLFIFLSTGEKILEADSQLRPLLSKFIGRLEKARNAVTQKKLQVAKPLGGSTARKGGKKKSRERAEDEEEGEEEEGEEEQEKDKEQEEGGGGRSKDKDKDSVVLCTKCLPSAECR